jgi:hypothetical protein
VERRRGRACGGFAEELGWGRWSWLGGQSGWPARQLGCRQPGGTGDATEVDDQPATQDRGAVAVLEADVGRRRSVSLHRHPGESRGPRPRSRWSRSSGSAGVSNSLRLGRRRLGLESDPQQVVRWRGGDSLVGLRRICRSSGQATRTGQAADPCRVSTRGRLASSPAAAPHVGTCARHRVRWSRRWTAGRIPHTPRARATTRATKWRRRWTTGRIPHLRQVLWHVGLG